ncbi:hypothetical protein A7E75_02150 [Syntrophotalea acetylenica]|uniref:Uncharacterized protein n=1 Tax=Syntrophotalea acetylenica TaxID=29542 RepID=A0A1L3GDD9_SYNAC|nr:hypothetical protein A7E75_02150 [Syntrophotalea acetylenica]APG44538.1 hypothetical protein A6070_10770 [Syntrophotalea acetylenica]
MVFCSSKGNAIDVYGKIVKGFLNEKRCCSKKFVKKIERLANKIKGLRIVWAILIRWGAAGMTG